MNAETMTGGFDYRRQPAGKRRTQEESQHRG